MEVLPIPILLYIVGADDLPHTLIYPRFSTKGFPTSALALYAAFAIEYRTRNRGPEWVQTTSNTILRKYKCWSMNGGWKSGSALENKQDASYHVAFFCTICCCQYRGFDHSGRGELWYGPISCDRGTKSAKPIKDGRSAYFLDNRPRYRKITTHRCPLYGVLLFPMTER